MGRKVNRELADAQRKLLNLQFTWSNMESELTELEWQESKGKEELETVQNLGQTLTSELEERTEEQEETDAELTENKESLAALQLQMQRAKGDNLDGISREALKEMNASLTQALKIVRNSIGAKEEA